MTPAVRVALVVVAVHLGVIALHDAAHGALGVGLLPWQTVYAYTLIVGAPLVGAGLLLVRDARWARAGAALVAASMLAALAFGAVHHYVLVSPDHVAHLPEGDAQGLFRATAAAMLVLEAAGAWAGWRAFGALRERAEAA